MSTATTAPPPDSAGRLPRQDGPPIRAEGGLDGPGSAADESLRRAHRRAARLGVFVWPAFTLLDWFMIGVIYPGAPLRLFLVYRVLVEVVLLVYSYLPRGTPIARVALVHRAAFVAAALGVTLMAVHLGGLQSAYVHGLSIIILVRATFLADPWTEGIGVSLAVVLPFPAIMGLIALVDPVLGAPWFTVVGLATFASHYVFVLASTAVALAAGHAVWAAQQQVYRARRLGRYRLEAPIGKGGMGEVWLAWDGAVRRNVALKLLRTGGTPDPSALRRFELEAHAASALRNPHTIRIFDFGASDDGIHFLAMEYLPGADLATLVGAHGPMPPARVVHLGLQACESLIEAHEAGIIHRDVKPHNLYVTRVGDEHDFLKLLDFGVARVAERKSGADLTRSGLLVGTPAYMAPELLAGARADARSDIHSLGATLYFCLSGMSPRAQAGEEGPQRVPSRSAPPLPTPRSGLPPSTALEEVVRTCLTVRPEERFADARQLRDALARCPEAGEWTTSDALAFWRVTRPQALQRWSEETQGEE